MARPTRTAHVGTNLFPEDKAEFEAHLSSVDETKAERIETLILEWNRSMRELDGVSVTPS